MKASSHRTTSIFYIVCLPIFISCCLAASAVFAYLSSPPNTVKPVVSLGDKLTVETRIAPAKLSAALPLPETASEKTKTSPTSPAPSDQNLASLTRTSTTAKPVASPAHPTPLACETNPMYPNPEAIDLSNTAPGLTVRADEEQYYTVYGQTPEQVRTALQHCQGLSAVVQDNHHATTRYTLNWMFVVSPLGNSGSCRLDNIRVGVHINQILPVFPDMPADSRLANYRLALQAHENGHKTITLDYANRLTDALRQTPALPCSMLHAQTGVTTQSYLHMIEAANTLYDSRTGHGETQGAVL